MKPLRLQMNVRNNRMVRAREDAGFETAADACRAWSISQQDWGKYESMRHSPLRIAYELYPKCVAPECWRNTVARGFTCNKHLAQKEQLSEGLEMTWTATALRVAAASGHLPDWLWPKDVRRVKNAQKVSVEIDAEQAAALSGLERQMDLAEMRRDVAHALDGLTEREQAVIRARFGFEEDGAPTLRELASVHGLSHERVSQIEQKAIRKLRHPSKAEILKEHL